MPVGKNDLQILVNISIHPLKYRTPIFGGPKRRMAASPPPSPRQGGVALPIHYRASVLSSKDWPPLRDSGLMEDFLLAPDGRIYIIRIWLKVTHGHLGYLGNLIWGTTRQTVICFCYLSPFISHPVHLQKTITAMFGWRRQNSEILHRSWSQ